VLVERFRGVWRVFQLHRDLATPPPSAPVQGRIEIVTALTENEKNCLAELARGAVVLEVGSQQGASTVAMAREAKVVHAVDWHRGDPEAGEGDTLLSYWRNLHAYGVRDRVVTHIGDSALVLPSLRLGAFSGVFLDGCHEEEAVRRDLALAEPLVQQGGWFAFHDYGRFGVTPVVDEFVENGDLSMRVVDSIAVVEPRTG
jgi:methyltransferase family protein